MSGTFTWAPKSLVAETLPPDPMSGISMNGWNFSSKPTVPYQKTFRVTLHGLRWYTNTDGTFNTTTDPTYNARALEAFYELNGTWDSFTWVHPHFGSLQARFKVPVQIPAGIPNSGGLCNPVEITLVHHNAAFT